MSTPYMNAPHPCGLWFLLRQGPLLCTEEKGGGVDKVLKECWRVWVAWVVGDLVAVLYQKGIKNR